MNKDAVNGSNIPHITIAAFVIGAVFSISSVLWTLKTTPEHPLAPEELEKIRSRPQGWRHTLGDIVDAVREMPYTMRQLAVVKLCQWYAMFCYWQYIVLSLSTTLFGTTEQSSQGFRDAGLINGQIGAFYNFIAFIAAFAMVPFTRKFGARHVHSVCLSLAGIGMLSIPMIHNHWLLFIPMIGIGVAWASIMGNPYIMLAGCIPPERNGVYMGIFNMFIVIPMIIQIFTLPLYYRSWLAGNPENVIRLAGALMLCGAFAVLFVKTKDARSVSFPSGETDSRPEMAKRGGVPHA